MIRKLFAGASVVAVAAIAVLLITVGTATTSAKPAEANVIAIGAVPQTGVSQYLLVQVDAQDNTWDFPNTSVDLDITASAGDFVELDPTFQAPLSGCSDQGFSDDSFRCEVNSNGFGQSNNFVNGNFDDVLTTLGFFTGTTHIQVCNAHTGFEDPGDLGFLPDGDTCDNNTSHVEAWWQAPPGFLGGTVTFCATQTTTKCTSVTVVGPIASLKLSALRKSSEVKQVCQGAPVYVIGSVEYTEGDNTTFDNDRAILCAEARDSNGTIVSGATLIWTTNDGCLDSNVTMTTTDVRDSENALRACATGSSGDIATVTVTNGGASASVKVQFGGDPASCNMVVSETSLNIGDHSHVVVTFLDSKGNWVPDGIIGHLVEVDSGDGADNVQFVSVTEDTVKGVIEGDIIGAIAGVTVVAGSVEHTGGADPVCSDEIILSGNIHTVPIVCTDPDMILAGFPPPAAGGFGTFEFCGGTWAQLLTASKCPAATSAFFYNKPSGTFATWIPGSTVAAPNAEILALWPEQIPAGTIFTAKCV